MAKSATIIMVLALTALTSCMAAPTTYTADALTRPSPINPAIPMDPKPAETITVITDPKELAKFKREIAIENSQHAITAPTTVQPTAESQQTYEDQISSTSNAAIVVKHRQKRAEVDDVLTQPLIYRDQHKQPVQHHQFGEEGVSVAPHTLPAPIPPPEHQTHTASRYEESKTLPNYYDGGKRSEMKRDIPVSLVPKYQHPEESQPEGEKHVENLSTTSATNGHSSTTTTSAIGTSTTNTAIHH